jgi:DNA-binding response OmpR family regulator
MGRGESKKPAGGSAKRAHPSQRARRRRVAADKLVRDARILVCETDLVSRPAVADLIRDLGYEVVAIHTLADALREAAVGAFDVIVASLESLDDQKLSLLQLLRRATAAVPLVIVTADGSLEMRKRCQGARPFYVALRPIADTELRMALTTALARSAPRG